MSFQKKNVIQEFMKEDYVPTAEQFLVKYCSGKGNNLHEVECVDGTNILVSMPKKYRHTVWLKKDDCLVIDPIEEGKKVKGEIVCVLPRDTVRDLISSKQWPSKCDNVDMESLLQFFTTGSDRKSKKDDLDDAFPPSESEEEEEEDEDEEDDDEEEESEGECKDDQETANDSSKIVNGSHHQEEDDVDNVVRDRNRSRVQLVTSGVVTVTNVLTNNEALDNDIQSLEFEADEESSDELSGTRRDLERHANTIRIQVNYKNANTCSGASGD